MQKNVIIKQKTFSSVMSSCLRRQTLNLLSTTSIRSTARSFSTEAKARPYEEIPTKRSILPSIGLILSGGPEYLHEHCDKRHKELGSIYREKLGQTELIFISDTKLIQTIIANEGQYPHHNVPDAWNFYNQIKGVERGLFFQIGEPWARTRKVLNKVLLTDSKNFSRFGSDLLQLNQDLLKTWSNSNNSLIVKQSETEFVVENVKPHLCKWSIEATGIILFGFRMGCIGKHNRKADSRAEELVENVTKMFEETSRFQILPVKLAHKFNLNTWKRFDTATTNMLSMANELANENILKVKNSNTGYSLVGDLLNQKELSEKEISKSVVDLIIAAADTTSNSLQWMLYLIAKHKKVQDKILEEANLILNANNPEKYMVKAPYTKSFMREVSRLYPTAPFLARTLDTDIVLSGYLVPKGTPIVFSLYTTSRMEEYFDEPLELKPERWLRRTPSRSGTSQCPITRNHAFASLPFGIGKRMCIGRRAAELEMLLFIVSFVKFYESSLSEEDSDVGVKLKMILCPQKPIRLNLKTREESS